MDNAGVTLDGLCRRAGMVRRMPCYYELKVGSWACIAVHAGYAENLQDIRPEFDSLGQFCLCAGEESCRLGGQFPGAELACLRLEDEKIFYLG